MYKYGLDALLRRNTLIDCAAEAELAMLIAAEDPADLAVKLLEEERDIPIRPAANPVLVSSGPVRLETTLKPTTPVALYM
jgi:hypothetical protein